MAIRFKNNSLHVINYGSDLSESDIERIKKNYRIDDVKEIRFICKGFGKSKKPWYLQTVDWIKLIPENIIHDMTFALKLPDELPREISTYMISECYSRSARFPMVLEFSEGEFHRIVDLEYEINFSRNKKKNNLK